MVVGNEHDYNKLLGSTEMDEAHQFITSETGRDENIPRKRIWHSIAEMGTASSGVHL
jgi:hypothetical protein